MIIIFIVNNYSIMPISNSIHIHVCDYNVGYLEYICSYGLRVKIAALWIVNKIISA